MPALRIASWTLLVVLAACGGDAATASSTEPPPTSTTSSTTPAATPSPSTVPPTTVPPTTTATTGPPTTTSTSTTAAPPIEGTTIAVSVTGGVATGPGRVTVDLGETVVLTVSADVADEVHLHGYDVLADVTPDEPAVLRFEASIPGVFEVELEAARLELLLIEVR